MSDVASDLLIIDPKVQAKELPIYPGVYFMKNDTGVIIYIGKAKNLKNRVTSYFVKQKNRPNRLKHLIRQIKKLITSLQKLRWRPFF